MAQVHSPCQQLHAGTRARMFAATTMSRIEDIEHIRRALSAAGELLLRLSLEAETNGHRFERKPDGQPVTQADLDADELLRSMLPRAGEGWLSEETVDDHSRLEFERVWIVDPLDGTKEFLEDVPEWSISVALVEDGEAVAGGIFNPRRDEMVVGALDEGCFLGDRPCHVSRRDQLDGATAVASRREVRRGQWEPYAAEGIEVVPTGSVAYKLALVACGRADLTGTLWPKSEWDVAAGAALVRAAGGVVWRPDDAPLRFNQPDTRLPGIIACPPPLESAIRRLLPR